MAKFVLAGWGEDGRSTVVRVQEIKPAQMATELVGGFRVDGELPAPPERAVFLDLEELGLPCPPGGAYWGAARHPPNMRSDMHYTATVDFDVVISGSTTLILEDGEIELGPGDCLLIDGVPHDWLTGPDGCDMMVLFIGKAVAPST